MWTPERDGNAVLFRQCEVVALPDVVQAAKFHHQMMKRVATGLDDCKAVMAWIDVEEKCLKWLAHEVGKAEAQHLLIEPHQRGRVGCRQHGVTEAQGASTKPGNRAPCPERLVRACRAVKKLQPVAGRVKKN